MKINLSEEIEIVVFTGPESSGKSTCVKHITKEYQLPLVGEYARTYLKRYGSEYTFTDIQNIAVKQMESEVQAHQLHSLIICDTDIVTLEIWALEVYQRSLNRIDELTDKKHYCLCYPDIPWEPDPLRENPKDRLRLFERYEAYLVDLGVSYTILKEDDRKNLQLLF